MRLLLILALAALAAPAAAKPVAAGPGETAASDSKPAEPAASPAAAPGKPDRAAASSGRPLREALGRILPDAGDLPLWAWPPLALLAFALLRLRFRRRGRDNLMGPPRPARYRNLPRY